MDEHARVRLRNPAPTQDALLHHFEAATRGDAVGNGRYARQILEHMITLRTPLPEDLAPFA